MTQLLEYSCGQTCATHEHSHQFSPTSTFPPLAEVTRNNLTTLEAAFYLNRKPQTLRRWACTEPSGVPRPIRINGRLAWPVDVIRALLKGGGK